MPMPQEAPCGHITPPLVALPLLSLSLSKKKRKKKKSPNQTRTLAPAVIRNRRHCGARLELALVAAALPRRALYLRARNRRGIANIAVAVPFLFSGPDELRRRFRPRHASSFFAELAHASRVRLCTSPCPPPPLARPKTSSRRGSFSAAAELDAGVAPVGSGKRRRSFLVARCV